jgi:hypothetical protein
MAAFFNVTLKGKFIKDATVLEVTSFYANKDFTSLANA